MIEAKCCVVCGGPLRRQRSGVIAPFVARRIWGSKPRAILLAECAECGFAFFNPRLEPAEEQRYYTGYRSAEYQQMRQSCEPWYTPELNAALSSPAAWILRKRLVSELFRDRLKLGERSFENLLDFGGHRGELIDGLVPASRRFVYEVSGVEPVAGVEALTSLEQCRQHCYDLILCSNVLEHLGSPKEVVAQIAELAGPQTLVFVEVPDEDVDDRRTRLKRLAQAAWLTVARPRVALQLTGHNVFRLMHEHVNYFSERSLNRLMEVCGFQVLASGGYAMSEGLRGERVLWSLARRS